MINAAEQKRGVIYAVTAHLIWAAMAPYLGLIRYIDPMEIAVHRGIWSVPLAGFVVWRMSLAGEVLGVFKNPRLLATLALTSGIILLNWTVYIWCIQNGHTLEASLGYFINPLLNVVAGAIFLGERFTRAQVLALGLTAVAVFVQSFGTGVFPSISFLLAVSFCAYGLLRKTISVSPVTGFFVEVLLLAGPLLALDAWLAQRGPLHFGSNPYDTVMLVGCGGFTTGALVFYALGIKRLRYATAGLIQYITPSIIFLVAIFNFGETVDGWKLAAFALIWLALAIYSWSSLQQPQAVAAS